MTTVPGLFREGYQVVPILCYHRFGATCRSALCVSETSFRAQLDYLKDNGYRTITLGELYEFITYKRAVPLRSVVITIDDGYRSIYDIAYPLLKEYGFTATMFIYTDFIGAIVPGHLLGPAAGDESGRVRNRIPQRLP
jgi:peptidoglycan/xylan/chitin deacetylase (PgdA/CDA1 family)